jgi:hypothetical protein
LSPCSKLRSRGLRRMRAVAFDDIGNGVLAQADLAANQVSLAA